MNIFRDTNMALRWFSIAMLTLLIVGCSRQTPTVSEQPNEIEQSSNEVNRKEADDNTSDWQKQKEEWKKSGMYLSKVNDKQFTVPVILVATRGLNDDALKQAVPKLNALRSPIYLTLDAVTDTGLSSLTDLNDLRGLYLVSDRVTDKGMENIAGLKNLEVLEIGHTQLTRQSLISINKIKTLRILRDFHSRRYSLEDLALLSNLSELIEPPILPTSRYDDTALSNIRHMTKLRFLKIGGSNLTDAGLKNLAALKKLETLTVENCRAFNGEGMAGLAEMKNLRSLKITSCGTINAEGTVYLKGLKRLEKLQLYPVEGAALEHISGLKELKELKLWAANIGDTGMQHLGGLTKLQELDLYHNDITDDGMQYLAEMTDLKNLDLSSNKVTDKGLSHLKNMTKMERLDLHSNKIGGTGLQHLTGMANLRTLWLFFNPVTDAGVNHLIGLKKLEEVKLESTRVSDQATFALKQALPRATITDQSGAEVALKKPVRPQPEDLTRVKADYTMTAEQFYDEFHGNQNAAVAKYRNKVIELTGTTSFVMTAVVGKEAYIGLKVHNHTLAISCFTAHPEPWALVEDKQFIRVKGKFPDLEFYSHADLVDCVVLEHGPNLWPRLTAAALANEYAKNSQETNSKYGTASQVVITGKLINHGFSESNYIVLTLEGNENVRIECEMMPIGSKQANTYEIGQQIRVMGKYKSSERDDTIKLTRGMPITIEPVVKKTDDFTQD